MEKNYNIDKHLRDSLKQMSVTPADSSFAKMMEKLEQKKKRRRFFIFLYSGLGGIAAFFIIYLMHVDVAASRENLQAENIKVSAPLKTTDDQKAEANNSEPGRTKASSLENSEVEEKKLTQNSESKQEVDKNELKDLNNSRANSQHADAVETNDNLIVRESEKEKSAITKDLVENERVTTKDLPEAAVIDTASALSAFYIETLYPLSRDTQPELQLLTSSSPSVPIEVAHKKKKSVRFMVAINGDPQVSDYLFSENKNRAAVFDSIYNKSTRKRYVDNKKEASKPYFTYAYGIKAGILIKDKWEVWLGAGMTRLKYLEKSIPAMSFNTAPGPGFYSDLTYKYIYYSAELRRIVELRPFLKMNFGAGLRLNRGYFSNRYKSSELEDSRVPTTLTPTTISPGNGYYTYGEDPHKTKEWDCRLDVKAGVIYDLGKRFQFRMSPGIFYTPTSMLSKTYLIKQKAYGVEMECLVVFKFN